MKTNEGLVSTEMWQGARVTCMEESFIETVPPIYQGYAIQVEQAIVAYYSTDVSGLVHHVTEMRRTWRRRSEEVVETCVQREHGTLFAPGTPFQLCFMHAQYTTTKASAKQRLQEIL